ncbi:MAG: CdaR family protein [Bacillota bacterium]|nr:CdaR family protein [Bacillota bacterium]
MRRLLADNRAVWAVAFVVALLLWGFAARNPTQQQNLASAPVELVHLPADLVATDVSPDRVTVTLAGTGLTSPEVVGLKARVDMSGARPGSRSYAVSEVPVPRGISLVGIFPDHVRVTLERRETRTLPVHVVTIGEPAQGMAVAGSTATPARVQVEGPSSRIWRISTVEVRVDVAGARADLRQGAVPVALDASGLEVHGVRFHPDQVTVDVAVGERPATRTLPVQAVVTGKPADGYVVAGSSVHPAQVTVSGDEAVLSGLQVLETAPVDVTGARSDLTQRVALRLPPGVTAQDVQAVQVTVAIRPKP